jgi:glucose/arabinose dehydrogenase
MADGAAGRPEIWAWGLRNPWRFAFDPKGRLVVADVGQNTLEEVSLVQRGDNLGWKVREASRCFDPPQGCNTKGLVDPIYSYGREDGMSITGGVVYTGSAVPALAGRYVFGDFVTGRLWALALPDAPGARAADPVTLGRWGVLPSTFARDERGEVYVADFAGGVLHRIDPVTP